MAALIDADVNPCRPGQLQNELIGRFDLVIIHRRPDDDLIEQCLRKFAERICPVDVGQLADRRPANVVLPI